MQRICPARHKQMCERPYPSDVGTEHRYAAGCVMQEPFHVCQTLLIAGGILQCHDIVYTPISDS